MEDANAKFWGAVGFFVGTFFFLGACTHDEDGLFGQTTAAWVQAIGAIAAIGGAAYLAAQHHARVAKDTARDQLITFHNLAHIAVRLVEDIEARGHAAFKEFGPTQHFLICERALDAIPFAQVTFPSLIYNLVEIRHQFDKYRGLYEGDWPEDKEAAAAWQAEMHLSCVVLLKRLGELRSEAEKCGAKSGPDGTLRSPRETPRPRNP